jgi:hypothetical protein
MQRLEREIADFSKDHDKRIKAAQAKLKAAKQVRCCRLWLGCARRSARKCTCARVHARQRRVLG